MERNAKIDYLRALSMFLIVIQHYVVWGIKNSTHEVFVIDSAGSFLNYFSMEALYLLSCIGVNCFIMITGYYMIDRYSYRWAAIMKLWLSTVYYSILLYVLTSYLGEQFQIKTLLSCCLPIWSDQYWFITKYFGLMLIAPFLSVMASRLKKQSYMVLLIVLFCMGFMVPYGHIYAGGTSLFWMVFVFLVGGYIKLHGLPSIISTHAKTISYSILLLFTIVITVVEAFMHTNYQEMSGRYELHSFASDSPIFFISLLFFIWASNKEEKKANRIYKVCVKISPFILAVYLIHMNPFLYRYIWSIIIPVSYIVPVAFHAVVSCMMIFILCILVDYLRAFLFQLCGVNCLVETIERKIKLKNII